MIITTNALYSVTIISTPSNCSNSRMLDCYNQSCIFLFLCKNNNKIIDKVKERKEQSCSHKEIYNFWKQVATIYQYYNFIVIFKYQMFSIIYVCCFEMKLKIFSSFALNSNKYINRWWRWCRYFCISPGWNWIHPHCALWTLQPGLD